MTDKGKATVSDMPRRNRSVPVLAATLALLLGACTTYSAYWNPSEAKHENQVDWVRYAHTVKFDRGAEFLSPEQRAGLDRFLATIEPQFGDEISIVPTSFETGANTLTGRRITTLKSYLSGLRLKMTTMPPMEAEAGANNDLTVIVGRYVVTSPRCPNWTKQSEGDPANRRSSSLGCATTTNLGLMVADPGDLIRGRQTGPGDGEIAARGVKEYREGKQKETPSLTPLILQSGVGSGQ